MGNLMLSKKHILASSPHIETTTPMSIANFTTDMIAPLKECKVYFEPKQEGSGDPSPDNIREIKGWNNIETRHTGKNLFDVNFFKNKTNVTVNGNTISGYVSPIHNVTYKELMPIKIPKGSIFTTKATAYRSVSDTGAGWSFWFVCANGERVRPFYTQNSTIIPTEYKGTLIAVDDIIGLDFGYYDQASTGIWYISNVQIEINASDTIYESYNGSIIPISFSATKNLFNENYEGITSSLTYHSLYVGNENVTASTNTPQYISPSDSTIKYSNIFIFAGQVTSGASTGMNDICIGRTRTVTPIDGYITIAYRNGYGVDPTQYHTQIEKGNVATFYEPYETIYGGYIDLIKGELVKTHELISLKAVGKYSGDDYAFWYTSGIQTLDITNDGVLCNKCKLNINTSGKETYNSFTWYNNGIIRWTEIDTMEMTKEDYNIYLNTNPLIVTYKLKTPIIYQLTPQTLKTLKGVNNIWSNANSSVEIKYWTH